MSSEIAIKVENLSKCYHIYDTPRDRLKQFVMPRLQRAVGIQPQQYYQEFWALKDVSFEVKKGETVGVIGRNGSGKSTLLQLICGTLNPTSGSIATNGRIAALLELGSGFNPEFTGRENVYLNCALLGLSTAETDSRFDDIVAFADIGNFIEQPVKTYSSGMFVRLAFAVNVVSQPDIMIVDEALAVGDMNFQAKCMTALTRIQDQGATVVFVSHDVGAVKSLCRQAVYLEHGKVVAAGAAPEVAEQYVRSMREEMSAEVRKFSRITTEFNPPTEVKSTSNTVADENNTGSSSSEIAPASYEFKRSEEFDRRVAALRYGSGGVRITYVELLDTEGNPLKHVEFNQEVRIVIYVEAKCVKEISANFQILDEKKINITSCGFAQVACDCLRVNFGECYRVEYALRLPLQEGVYSVKAQVVSPLIIDHSADFLDVVDDTVVFRVKRWQKATIWSKAFFFPSLKYCRCFSREV